MLSTPTGSEDSFIVSGIAPELDPSCPDKLCLEEFVGFPKMGRFFREVIITEKIDGTNAQIFIDDFGHVFAGSRTRWITTGSDNYGFARWVHEHAGELRLLGPGRHFGEWWGSGINRNYGRTNGSRTFSLFNTIRWCRAGGTPLPIPNNNPTQAPRMQEIAPACCDIVPVLHRGPLSIEMVQLCMASLQAKGSVAQPGFMNPEGVVIFHTAGQCGFKYTLGGDGAKGAKA